MDREIRVEAHRLIRAPLHRVWQLLSRLESHPRYVSLWFTTDVTERSQSAALVEFRGFLGGLPITSVQRVVLRPPGRIEFRQVRGTLRAMAGAYLLKDADGDTDVTAHVAVDAGIVLFTDASVQQILAAHLDGTLTRIKASAERDLVRVVVRRSQGATEVELPSAPDALPEADGEPPEPAGVAPAGVVEEAGGDSAPEPASVPSSGTPSERQGRHRRRRRRRHRGGGPPPSGPAP